MLALAKLNDGSPEIFRSIQGEGTNSGATAAFIRLAFCNLKCSWCDTKYTWDWQHYNKNEEVVMLSSEEVFNCLRSLGTRHLVVTGGEPLLQQDTLSNVASSLKREGYYIEVETNGTIPPSEDLESSVDQWNVSPKLENSGNPSSLSEVPESVGLFTRLSSSYFKFVIQADSDLNDVYKFVRKYQIEREKVILMPEGTERETILNRGKWLADSCRNQGYRFCTRLHILLWGSTRGV